MQRKITLKFLGATLLSLVLTACGGGKGSALQNTLNGTPSSGASSSFTSEVSNGGVDTISPTKLGNGESATFAEGVIGLNNSTEALSAGGTAILNITVVSSTNTLVTTPVDVTFNSPCVASGEAVLRVGTVVGNKVTATNGAASIVYTANGCVGDDPVIATASIQNKVVNARVNVRVLADTVQTMKFVDATPNQISLKGVGGNETSVVRFQVVGSTGAPIKGIDVDFKLSTEVGGMSLTNATVKSDKSGYAATTVQAGTIQSAVRVTATARQSGTFTTSSQLIVSTGIPDQKSMTLSATDLFPVGWDIDGVKSTLTVRLADAFNNPAPVGTTVAFTTEGGSIVAGCSSNEEGACSVTWTSANPKPTRNSTNESPERKLCVELGPDNVYRSVADYAQCRKERAGRVTVLATAIGNESFIDTNGDGNFDAGDRFNTAAKGGNCTPNTPKLSAETPVGSSTIPCDDLGEAYLDKDESDSRSPDEQFIDFTSSLGGAPDSAFNSENGKYNGVLCPSEGDLCTKKQVTIRRDLGLIMTSRYMLTRAGTFPFLSTSLYTSASKAAEAGVNPAYSSSTFLLADLNGNGIGAGTTLSIDATNLKDGVPALSNKGPIPGGDDPVPITVSVTPSDETKVPSGSFNVIVTTPTSVGPWVTIETISVNYVPPSAP